jgi:hypothetical protein
MLLLAVLVPAYVIAFRKMGWSGWWAALVFVPFGVLVLPWVIALNLRDERSRVDYEDVFGGGDADRRPVKRGTKD